MNKTENTDQKESERLSVGFLLLQGMTAMYNREAYTQDIVFEFKFTETGETLQLQVFRDECKVTASELKHYTVRLETSLENMQKIADFKNKAPELDENPDCKIEGDKTALHKLPALFSSRTQSQNPDTISPKNSRRFILHAPLLALWVGIIFHQFWGAILILLIALACIKAFFRSKEPILTYFTVAAGIIAGLLCVINENNTIIFSLTYILLGIIWALSCFSRSPLLLPYLQDMYYTNQVPRESLLNGSRLLCGLWTAAFIILGILIYFYNTEYDNTKLIGASIITFAIIWLITRHVMVLYFKAKPKEDSHSPRHQHD